MVIVALLIHGLRAAVRKPGRVQRALDYMVPRIGATLAMEIALDYSMAIAIFSFVNLKQVSI